jgi:hypothetical protein
MSEYQQYYEAFSVGYWSDPDPAHCGCRGGGWALSEVDTWHRCPQHGAGVPHPEERHEGVMPEWRKCEDEGIAPEDEDQIPF